MGTKITLLNHLIYSLTPAVWLVIAFNSLEASIFFIPKTIFIVIVFAILLVISFLIANSNRDTKHKKHTQMYISIIEMMLLLWIIFADGNFENILVEKVVSFMIGIIIYYVSFAFIGLKRNQFLGVKTPGALESDKIWDLTHKVSAVAWPIGSLLLFSQLFWDKQEFSVPILLISGIFIIIIPLSMSYDIE